jgi:two-component system LytT family response regulator
MLRALVVDDEAPARRKLLRLLGRHPDIEIVGEAASAQDALAQVHGQRPDLLFLDVEMPGTDGLGVARTLLGESAPPRIVFVTAHAEHAVRAFEVEAIDYILKPVDEDRLHAALARVRRAGAANELSSAQLERLVAQLRPEPAYRERILVEQGERAFFVAVRDVVRIEANRNYVVVHAAGASHTLRTPLDALEETLNPRDFVRVNRSTLVRIDAIRELRSWFHGEYKVVLSDGAEVTWTRRYVARRPELLGGV